jgi:hypothetical protein
MEELAVRHLEALGITKPSEIDINVLTNKANIDFNYGLFSCYGEQENYKMILIDESVNELRELQIHFLHEYAHFLLGHEEKLSDAISGHIHQVDLSQDFGHILSEFLKPQIQRFSMISISHQLIVH